LARDVLCFSHLRWDFVYQRPNHLMARAARDRRVFFVEEPRLTSGSATSWSFAERAGVIVSTPNLPEQLDDAGRDRVLAALMDDLIGLHGINVPVLWYYTPMALPWTRHIVPAAVVFDCMDHLAGFNGAPPALVQLEAELLSRADLVVTGGAQLHEAKRRMNANTHCFPSSVDVAHFAQALVDRPDPIDQAPIPHPRFGYFGVIDERLDLGLVAAVAAARPAWHFVFVGPVTKIDPSTLPKAPNVHFLGMKDYADLPAYLTGWDVAIMPFAHNEATRYISPTKTPEYLAGGLPVASTSIHDVVHPYGQEGLVEIGDEATGFLAACERALATDPLQHDARVGPVLERMSWDRTWAAIDDLLSAVTHPRSDQVAARGDEGSGHASARDGAGLALSPVLD
jgi:UDP-galactopyranose mutase